MNHGNKARITASDLNGKKEVKAIQVSGVSNNRWTPVTMYVDGNHVAIHSWEGILRLSLIGDWADSSLKNYVFA